MADWGIGYEVEIKGLKKQLEKIERMGAIAQPKLVRAMTRSLGMVQAEAQKRAPVGVSGELRSKIGSQVTHAMGTDVQGVVGASAQHAAAVETGSRAHFPPVSNIAYWVDRKMGYKRGETIYGHALAIARAIARRGTRAHPFMKPAYEKFKGRVADEFKAAIDETLKDMEVRE